MPGGGHPWLHNRIPSMQRGMISIWKDIPAAMHGDDGCRLSGQAPDRGECRPASMLGYLSCLSSCRNPALRSARKGRMPSRLSRMAKQGRKCADRSSPCGNPVQADSRFMAGPSFPSSVMQLFIKVGGILLQFHLIRICITDPDESRNHISRRYFQLRFHYVMLFIQLHAIRLISSSKRFRTRNQATLAA